MDSLSATCQAGVQERGITQRILTGEDRRDCASWTSASALRRPSRLELAAANRTRPALDRSA